MTYKRPESVLVVISACCSQRVLMLQRCDDPDFWQSVTGSLELGESAIQAAQREVKEEIGIDIEREALAIVDCQHCVEFELFAHLRYRYAPGVTHNLEHWFSLVLPTERDIFLTEHRAYQWMHATQAAKITKSWSNQQAIQQYITWPAHDQE